MPTTKTRTAARSQRASNLLRLADDLALDADAVAGGSLALLGQRGAGKTYTCRVLVEELVAAHVQTVVIDPMGAFWGLRSSADGEHEGLPIPVFGGEHADAPLEPTAGALMADLVVDEGLSMVLDLSQFSSRTQERTFAAAFLDRLYRRNRDLVHLVVDEADLFAPQKPRGEDTRLLVTMENIVRRGRNKGIGVSMATQRPAVLHKDVLTQVDTLVAMRVTGPQDRNAIREWVQGQGDEQDWSKIAPSLPSLANGESWWWVPRAKVLKRVQVRPARTFDSSSTRTRKQGGRTPKTFADVDLAAITSRIEATIERSRDADPRELHRRITSLERDLHTTRAALAKAQAQVAAGPGPATPAGPAVDPDLLARLERLAQDLVDPVVAAGRARTELVDRLADITEHADRIGRDAEARVLELGGVFAAALAALTVSVSGDNVPTTAEPVTAITTARSARSRPARPVPEARAPREEGTVTNLGDAAGDGAVTPARRRLLDALAEMEGIGVPQVAKTQLALWATVSPKSSGYSNNLDALRSAGLIDYPAAGRVALTAEGRAQVSLDPAAIPGSTEDLHERVRGLLPPARWRVLEPLLAAYPDAVDKAVLAEEAGVSATSSGYSNNLGALRSLGLIDYPTPGRIAATEVLFLAR